MRVRLDVHYAIKDETSIVLPLQQVLPEVTRYARDTGHGEALLGEDAYKRMVKEMAARPGGYVKECSVMADFRLQSGGKRSQRRGILVDVDALEGELEIDRDVWFATGGKQTAGPIVAEWNGMQAGRASN